jgi:RND family efflux transporter MFP subunit
MKLVFFCGSCAMLLVTVLAGCSKEPAPAEAAVPVQVEKVQQTTLQHIVTAEGIVYPVQQSAIVPKISAPVQKFYVMRGDHVRKGQLLATLENRDLAAAAKENQGALDQAQAAYTTTTGADLPQELQKAQLDFDAAKATLDAQQKIYTSREELYKQGALPRKELDQAGVDLTNARNTFALAQQHLQAMQAIGKQQTLKSATGQLESAKGRFMGSEAQLSYSEIRSPINGVVTDRPLYAGEMASSGTPLLTVMDTAQVIVRAHLPQQDAALLKVGDAATISAPGVDEKVPGKVTVVSPALDPNSTTVEIWIRANNPKDRLRPGTNAQVSMVAQTIPNALVVPAVALLTAQDGGTSVMVVGPDGRAHQQEVKAGIRQGDQVEIVSGLHAGQEIVTQGAYGLPDNSKIQISGGTGETKAEAGSTDKQSHTGKEGSGEK